jgi:hypothetical protein
LSREDCDEKLAQTLAALTTDFMVGVATSASRPGGFVPAFRLVYTDTATMVTVGGVLPAKGALPAVRAAISAQRWPALVDKTIVAPHLTLREAGALQAQLPSGKKLTRRLVQRLGFDLEEEQISSFEEFYKYYPSFAQISI